MHVLLVRILCAVTTLVLFLATLSFGQPDKPQAMNLATWLKHLATGWDKEMCEKEGPCEGQEVNNPDFPFSIPKITAEDKCHPDNGFDKETCLRALASGLFHMEVFLKNIQETLVDTEFQPPKRIWATTRHLANTLKSLMEDPGTVTYPDEETKASYSQTLASYTGFRGVVVRHLVLQSFISFMENVRNVYTYMQ